MANIQDIEKAFQQSGIGRSPTQAEISFYLSSQWPDAGKVEGDLRKSIAEGTPMGASLSSGYNTDINSILQTAIDSVTSMIPKPKTPYDEVNPFFFDEALAKEAATAEFAPYYDEMLSDYISNVERTKSRSSDDLDRVLKQLEAGKEYYMGTERKALERAEKSTNEGFAGRGLFFSGMRPNEIKELQEDSAMKTGNYMQNYGYQTEGAQTSYKRGLEDIDTALSQYTRDTERQKETAIAGGVLTRKGEVRDEYEMGRQKYYDTSLSGGMSIV
jgi:hypothetical protein